MPAAAAAAAGAKPPPRQPDAAGAAAEPPPPPPPRQRPELALRLLPLAAALRGAYLLLLLGVGWLIADYDTSAGLLSEACDDGWPAAVAAEASSARRPRYAPAVVWDAVFLHRIAACGYEYEQFFAFFPGLPGAPGRGVARAPGSDQRQLPHLASPPRTRHTGLVRLARASGLLHGPWGFSVAVLVVNSAAFLASVALLTRCARAPLGAARLAALGAPREQPPCSRPASAGWRAARWQRPRSPPCRPAARRRRLSQHFLRDDRLAAAAVALFAASPASVHHALLYTEALFTAASWAGAYCLYCRRASLGASLAAALAFAASAALRSNGLLNAGFLLHEHGRRGLAALLDRRWVRAAGREAAPPPHHTPQPRQTRPPPAAGRRAAHGRRALLQSRRPSARSP